MIFDLVKTLLKFTEGSVDFDQEFPLLYERKIFPWSPAAITNTPFEVCIQLKPSANTFVLSELIEIDT